MLGSRRFLLPELPEEAYGGWCVSGVVIVSEAEYRDITLIEVSAGLDPLVEFPPAVHDDLVPGLRLLLDLLTVPKPTYIGEVSSDEIKLFLHLPRPRHPTLVGQRQGDVVLAEHIRESAIEPALVANLDGKPTGEHLLEPLQEEAQTRKELANALECALVEVRKL